MPFTHCVLNKPARHTSSFIIGHLTFFKVLSKFCLLPNSGCLRKNQLHEERDDKNMLAKTTMRIHNSKISFSPDSR